MPGFFKAFLHTANWDLRMATSTAKCNLWMAHPAQFLYEKAWWNLFSKTNSFFVFHMKKPHINMWMKLTPGSASPTILFPHIYVLLFYDLIAKLSKHMLIPLNSWHYGHFMWHSLSSWSSCSSNTFSFSLATLFNLAWTIPSHLQIKSKVYCVWSAFK